MTTFERLDKMTPQDIVEVLHRELSVPDTVIARLVCCSAGTIWRIRQGKESGRNIAPYLRNIAIAIDANEAAYTVQYGWPARQRS